MFQRFGEIFRRHPLWIVGGVIALVILIWLMMRGGSTPQMAVYSSGPTDAQVQGAYALQAAQINANAATAQAQLSNEATANNNATALALNAQNTNVANLINSQNSAAAVAINANSNSAAIQINGQNVAAATNITAINAQTAAAINANNNDTATRIAAGQQAVDMISAQADYLEAHAGVIAAQGQADAQRTTAFYQGRNAAVATDALYNAVNNRYGVNYVKALTGN